MAEPSLYDRLGGVFAIAAVIDHFSDSIVKNPLVGQGSKNPDLDDWHTNHLDRLPGLKFMRTLWVCDISGGPITFNATKPGSTPLGLEEAHRDLHITPDEFDEVAAELGRTLDHFGVPPREKDEVLAAFAAHTGEVTEGSRASAEDGRSRGTEGGTVPLGKRGRGAQAPTERLTRWLTVCLVLSVRPPIPTGQVSHVAPPLDPRSVAETSVGPLS